MIKKISSFIVLMAMAVLLSFSVQAAPPSITVSGPATVRAGNTITVSVRANGTSILSVKGELTYNSSLLTYRSHASPLGGWSFDIDGQSAGKVSFLGIDDTVGNNPISSQKQLFTVTFVVNSTAAVGTNIKVTPSALQASDGNADYTPSASAYSVNLAAPLSTNTNLSSLVLSNATLSPAFSSGVTAYSTTVPFEVTILTIRAAAADSGAKVSISGNNLSVGNNNVTIAVSAPSGAVKNYTIAVKREQDPNYVPGSSATLTDIRPSVGILSPEFDSDKTEYMLYLPHEVELLSFEGETEDPKASFESGGQISLNAGENIITLKGVAENGDEREYIVVVMRMPLFDGTTAQTTAPPTTEPPTETETTPPETTQTEIETTQAIETTDGEESAVVDTGGERKTGFDGTLSFGIVIVIGVVCAMAGFGACFFVLRGKKD